MLSYIELKLILLTCLLDLTGEMYDMVEESLEEDSSCEGTGYYAIQSCANHSCKPNAGICCPSSNECCLTAKQKIRKGEEISISYIDEESSFEERQKALQDYGFKCTCKLCIPECKAKA